MSFDFCHKIFFDKNFDFYDKNHHFFLKIFLTTETGHCTASIINKNWVITAAHCLKDSPTSAIDLETVVRTFVVKIGMNTLVKRPTFRISDAFVPDPNADIVLIRLAMSIDFKKTNSGVVCLPPDGHREHQEQHFYKVNCYSAGFGFLGMNPITPAKYLQVLFSK